MTKQPVHLTERSGHAAMESEVLKPCPFCGGEASANGVVRYDAKHEAWFSDGTRVREAFFCNCMQCSATNKGLIGHQTREMAIAAWNRRPAPSELEEMKKNAERYLWLREQIRDQDAKVRAQGIYWAHTSRKQLDAAVDAAMAEGGKR